MRRRFIIFRKGLWLFALLVFVGCSSKEISPEASRSFQAQKIRVQARQFLWEITQAGSDGLWNTADDRHYLNEIIVPEKSRLLLELHAQDVVHGFWVPGLGIRQTLVPGVTFQKEVLVTEPGKYKIACSELCGAGHARMVGWVYVLPREEYDQRPQAGPGQGKLGLNP